MELGSFKLIEKLTKSLNINKQFALFLNPNPRTRRSKFLDWMKTLDDSFQCYRDTRNILKDYIRHGVILEAPNPVVDKAVYKVVTTFLSRDVFMALEAYRGSGVECL